MKVSGLQKEVLSLYRRTLREAMKKDRNAVNPIKTQSSLVKLLSAKETTVAYAKEEFRRQAKSVLRSNFKTVEHKIRQGEKQIRLLRMPGVKVVSGTAT